MSSSYRLSQGAVLWQMKHHQGLTHTPANSLWSSRQKAMKDVEAGNSPHVASLTVARERDQVDEKHAKVFQLLESDVSSLQSPVSLPLCLVAYIPCAPQLTPYLSCTCDSSNCIGLFQTIAGDVFDIIRFGRVRRPAQCAGLRRAQLLLTTVHGPFIPPRASTKPLLCCRFT